MKVEELWAEYKKIPVNSHGYISEEFLHFKVDTHIADICSWFEKNFNVLARDLSSSYPRPRSAYMATIQILVCPKEEITNDAEAYDWFSGLLTDNVDILDWRYLKIGEQYLQPKSCMIDLNKYEEGDFLNELNDVP